MTENDKSALAGRLDKIGMVTPALAEGQPDTIRDIETITGEILEAKRVGGEAIITIGQRLIEAKALLSHGEWLSWLSEKVEFSESTAQRFMRLAREWTNPSTLTDLGASKALALLALPEPEREEFIAENHVEDMTARELAKAIKERDEARKAAEQAQADRRTAEEERQSLMESIKAANALLDLAKSDKEQAASRVAALEKELTELKAQPTEVAVMAVDQEQLDQARAEGEAVKAEEIAKLQAELEKVKAKAKKETEKWKQAEEAAIAAQEKLEAAEKVQKQAAAMADPVLTRCEVYLNQGQAAANQLQGERLSAQNKGDQVTADKIAKAMLALSDAIRRAAK